MSHYSDGRRRRSREKLRQSTAECSRPLQCWSWAPTPRSRPPFSGVTAGVSDKAQPIAPARPAPPWPRAS